MGKYFLSVICGAILCAITANLTERKGTSGAVLKLISGIFLTFTVIQPIASVKLEELDIFTADLTSQAQSAASMGQQITQESMIAIIKQETEAYILDKAAALNGTVQADVTVGEDLAPESVILTGKITPYGREQLEMIMETDLGIAKENQQWSD